VIRRSSLALSLLIASACTSPGAVGPTDRSIAPTGSGATGAPAASPSGQPISLTVLAAASLRDVLAKIATAYVVVHPEVALTVTTDSSATLASQIIAGAPGDLFLSADETAPKRIVDAGLADGAAVRFASNQLALIVPAATATTIRSPADLARPGLKIIAAGTDVPITRYATTLIDQLAMQPGYPAGFAAAYAANVVSREDNVKAVVAKIELGEGDAAIVYATDAAASTKVVSIPIPDGAQVRAAYAGVVLRTSTARDAAQALITWIRGPDCQALLAGAGFQPPTP
jgi:molybdate transport system substrate-binding protein